MGKSEDEAKAELIEMATSSPNPTDAPQAITNNTIDSYTTIFLTEKKLLADTELKLSTCPVTIIFDDELSCVKVREIIREKCAVYTNGNVFIADEVGYQFFDESEIPCYVKSETTGREQQITRGSRLSFGFTAGSILGDIFHPIFAIKEGYTLSEKMEEKSIVVDSSHPYLTDQMVEVWFRNVFNAKVKMVIERKGKSLLLVNDFFKPPLEKAGTDQITGLEILFLPKNLYDPEEPFSALILEYLNTIKELKNESEEQHDDLETNCAETLALFFGYVSTIDKFKTLFQKYVGFQLVE
ncbi:hypothetical protein EIN_221720 [Entamoeba invadens IP1]|uniref:Uncharacterized protein n=1 Tax=Entamoeba invadens IP1 TaxID=370355 RepID=A0A0A1U217_ENTIV|nr:hypothetical protein EIN_221720 [Entamoeba invadens IP1]ELP88049.1 hypothetical protein EIN_221720 [Entamoeba invadens IP1]|eukprot:XP_004254820.1 hypothetical protein EIN_221720 [Entamoeba invadens IP1]